MYEVYLLVTGTVPPVDGGPLANIIKGDCWVVTWPNGKNKGSEVRWC